MFDDDDLDDDGMDGGVIDQDDDEVSDQDANLILDYLSNRLDPEGVKALETRARADKDFRDKLADIVLLKGLVMLALEKKPAPQSECGRSHALFHNYLDGKTTASETAALSKHLDDCLACAMAFDRFAGDEDRGEAGVGDGSRRILAGRKRRVTRRSVAIGAIAMFVLAAVAYGLLR